VTLEKGGTDKINGGGQSVPNVAERFVRPRKNSITIDPDTPVQAKSKNAKKPTALDALPALTAEQEQETRENFWWEDMLNETENDKKRRRQVRAKESFKSDFA
jgi:hypothetical protein